MIQVIHTIGQAEILRVTDLAVGTIIAIGDSGRAELGSVMGRVQRKDTRIQFYSCPA